MQISVEQKTEEELTDWAESWLIEKRLDQGFQEIHFTQIKL